jgi:hypothetical protein
MRKLGFKQKLWLPLLVSLTALLLVSISAAWLSYQTRIEERKNDLVNVAHIGLSIVEEYAALAKAGTLTEDQARKQALARLRDIRYGEDGYFLVINSRPQMVMHPMKPAMNGKDLGDVADADGRHHYVAFASTAQAPQGGFVDYVFPRPHVTPAKAVDKLGYVVRYAPWDWIIATGAYTDDIAAAFHNSLYAAGGVFLVLAVLLALLVALINRSIERTIGGDPHYAADVTEAIASGNLAIGIRTRRNDTDSAQTHCRRDSRRGRQRGRHRSPDCQRQCGPLGTHREPGGRAAANRVEPRRNDLDGASDRGECPQREPARDQRRAGHRPRWRDGDRSGRHHARHLQRIAEDGRHHCSDRRHRLSDQYPRVERRRRSRAGR